MSGFTPTRGTGAWVAPLCWMAVLLDGFDLVVLGAVVPSLLDYRPLGPHAGERVLGHHRRAWSG